MKIADIVVPGDYEVSYSGNKVTIVSIESRARTVSEAHSFLGHKVVSKMAIAENGRAYTARDIIRPWEFAQKAITKEGEMSAEIENLVDEFKSLFPSDTRRHYSHYSNKITNGIEITLSIDEMKDLIARLAGH